MKRSIRTMSAVLGLVAVVGALTAPANAATKKTTKKTVAKKVTPTTKLAAPATTAAAATPVTAAPAAALPPLTKPIRILVINAEGTASTNQPEVHAGAEAAAKRINAAGGVRGAKIEIVYCNDQVDATTALACARQASNNIDAVITTGRVTGTYPPIFAPIGLPVFDFNASDVARLDSDQYMVIGSGAFGNYAGVGIAGVKAGGKKVAVYRSDTDATIALAQYIRQGIISAGGTSPIEVKLPSIATDLSPQAQQIKASGADMVCGVAAEQLTMLLFQALDQIGANVRFCTTDQAISLGTMQKNQGLLEGTVLANVQPQVGQLKSDPVIDAFLADLIASGGEPRESGKASGLLTWSIVGVIADVAKTMPTVDGKSLTAALNKSVNLKVPGFSDWTPGAVGPIKGNKRISDFAFYASIIKNGRPFEFINKGDASPAIKAS